MKCETRIMCRAHVLEKGPKKRVRFFQGKGPFPFNEKGLFLPKKGALFLEQGPTLH